MPQYSTALRNAKLNALVTLVGASPTLKIFTGSKPANPATADSGTVLSTVSLPATWMNAASGGSMTKANTWEDASADAAGTAGYYRIYDSGGTCHIQGTVSSVLAGTGEMQLDNTVFALGQDFKINSYTINDGNP